jgi:aspartate dehydrogenase
VVIDLDALDGPATFFTGSAREAAAAYPKNANVAATLALAGAGFDKTRVALIADPSASGNLHAYEVRSPLATYSFQVENRASPGNARTSAATIYSALREIRNRIGPVVI